MSASKQKAAYDNFKLHKLSLETPDVAQQEFGSQITRLPEVSALLGKASDLDNAAVQGRIAESDPNAASNTKSVSSLALSRSLGGLTQDTQDAIKRANAYAALQGGYAGSSMAGSAEDLKTAQARMGMINQAPQLNSTAMQMSKAFSPANPDVASTLISPEAILQRDDSEATYNNDILNQNALAQLGATAAGQQKQASSASTGISSMMGGIGGMMGGGGGDMGGIMSMIGGI